MGNWVVISLIIFFLLPIWIYIVVRLVAKGTFRSLFEELSKIFNSSEGGEK